MAETIAFVLRNLPVFLFVAALALAATVSRSGAPAADRLLAWILLLPIGVSGLWAALFHLFFPEIAAADIGWEPSPFQFEVGMADLAIGATACLSFWRSLDFKAAAVMVDSIFLLGDAVGHVRQMIVAGNFAPGNAGVPFYSDSSCPCSDRSPDRSRGVRRRRRGFPETAQKTITLRTAAPEREEASASLIASSR